jgi:para-aminobenzoate synthetase/4-amino-4-deoxychorismate lyase
VPLPDRRIGIDAALWLRGEPRPVALSGAWARGSLLLASHPVAIADPADDPFALLDDQPTVDSEPIPSDAVGGGWLGWLGFGLAGDVEPVPPSPPRPVPSPRFDLAFHDHVVRRDASGRWWFEALWTDARDEFLTERLHVWSARLAGEGPTPAPVAAGPLAVTNPGATGHAVAVADAVDRIAAGEIFQVNLCLRFDGSIDGDPLDLWVRAARASDPQYAGYVGGVGRAVASLSPELFLRVSGSTVISEPIKGTAPLSSDPDDLLRSEKDRAENIMIVDLMRNDLGRVCAYGTVAVTGLCELRRAAGVWHLVSTVRGTTREGVGAGDVVRAAFPPGSVTGAPKVRALRVISELEASGREAYCGSLGLCSPLAGLELNVMIRTFETCGSRIWLGAGGAVVADSSPESEVRESFAKARGIASCARVEIVDDFRSAPSRVPSPALTEPRPDPARGVFETLLVADGVCVAVQRHLHRLRRSCEILGFDVRDDLENDLERLTAPLVSARVRIAVDRWGTRITTGALPEQPAWTLVRPVVLPGGLGVHKWSDRTLIDAHSARGRTPLFCDLDGHVLEAGYAAVLLCERSTIVAPPLDGRQLPSVSRARLLEAAPTAGFETLVEPITLDRLQAADAVVLCSALRRAHPGALTSAGPPPHAEDVCARLNRAMDGLTG